MAFKTEFKFTLPKEQIALYPSKDRDGSRLMVLDRKTGKIEHKKFKDIINYFDEGDTFIVNDTKVFPARMWGNKEKTGAKQDTEIVAMIAYLMRLGRNLEPASAKGASLRVLTSTSSSAELMRSPSSVGDQMTSRASHPARRHCRRA